jgi:hypothetical protein
MILDTYAHVLIELVDDAAERAFAVIRRLDAAG